MEAIFEKEIWDGYNDYGFMKPLDYDMNDWWNIVVFLCHFDYLRNYRK